MQKGKSVTEIYGRVKNVLEAEEITVSGYQLIDYGLQFTVSTSGWSGIMRIYENKKGESKIDYSQLKDKASAARIKALIEGEKISHEAVRAGNIDLGFPIIGTDESGKGDYFGPLVSAGVYVDEQSAKELVACGVKDSKKATDSKNRELAQQIPKICKGRFAVIEISPEKYNDLYEQFRRESKNLNTLLAWGHAKAIEEVLSKVDCGIAMADQFADEKFIAGKLQERGKKIRLVQVPKAEQNIAVAAASVLSRARFLDKLSKLGSEYKMELQKGASSDVIKNAKEFVRTYGKETLRKVAKLHFRITAQIGD